MDIKSIAVLFKDFSAVLISVHVFVNFLKS